MTINTVFTIQKTVLSYQGCIYTTINKKYLFVLEYAYVLGKTIIMEPSDIKELFMYNHTVRQSYIDEFQKNIPWQEMLEIMTQHGYL
jgi:hypothetical protein